MRLALKTCFLLTPVHELNTYKPYFTSPYLYITITTPYHHPQPPLHHHVSTLTHPLSLSSFCYSLPVLFASYLIILLISTSTNYGHRSYPFIGSFLSFHRNRRRLIHWFTDLLSKSASQTIVLTRFGGRRNQMIVTANPTNIEHILKTRFENYPKGKPFTDLLGDFLGIGIFNVDGDLWSTQRKLASHEFSTKSLREFVVSVLEDEVTNRFIPLLENSIQNDKVLDMQDVLKTLAFDTICKISLGWDPCCLDYTRAVSPLASAFDVAAGASAMRGRAPTSWVWKVKRFLNVGSEGKLKEAVGVVHRVVDEIIRKRREQLDGSASDHHRDLLSRFIISGHSNDLVRDMVISFLMAGRDTSSAAMTWLFWLLTQHPTAEKEVLKDVTFNGDKLNFEDLKRMDYLKACLCESMRLYPPVVWDSKHAREDDVLPDGTTVYKGNRVMYFPYGMGRMETLWGKDCLEFRPDRWFTETGCFKMESPYKFPVFQGGPRVCLGKEMAFIQMKYVMASVLRRFELVPLGLGEPGFVPLLTAHMDSGFKVRVRRRSDL